MALQGKKVKYKRIQLQNDHGVFGESRWKEEKGEEN